MAFTSILNSQNKIQIDSDAKFEKKGISLRSTERLEIIVNGRRVQVDDIDVVMEPGKKGYVRIYGDIEFKKI